jgi:hypothetical protein
MKSFLLFCAAILTAAVLSACVGANGQPPDNDRIHGAMGVGVTNLNTSRIIPERPDTAPPSSAPSTTTPSGPVLIPGSSSN